MQYPRSVALVGFLISPYWTAVTSVPKSLSFGAGSQLDLISAEISRRFGMNYRLHGKDRIYEHLTTRLWEGEKFRDRMRASRRQEWSPVIRLNWR